MDFVHTSVMLAEVLEALAPKTGGRYVDCTCGGGGHSGALLDLIGSDGSVLGLDRDPDAIAHLEENIGRQYPNLVLRRSDFIHVDDVLAELEWEAVDGMILDLGISSNQLEQSGRGFSFDREEPLDMRMDPDLPVSARDLVNRLPETKLADLIYQYGEERGSRRVARAIVRARSKQPIDMAFELAEIVRKALWRPGKRPRVDSATRTFQALRLAVNSELESLQGLLDKAPGLLAPGGRLVVISFHSLEDRLVKRAMIKRPEKSAEYKGRPILKALYKKPLTPSEDELAANPRSRSAKLRAGERMDG